LRAKARDIIIISFKNDLSHTYHLYSVLGMILGPYFFLKNAGLKIRPGPYYKAYGSIGTCRWSSTTSASWTARAATRRSSTTRGRLLLVHRRGCACVRVCVCARVYVCARVLRELWLRGAQGPAVLGPPAAGSHTPLPGSGLPFVGV
jgi:hypothetical protein